MNNDNPYAAQFMASMNNPQPAAQPQTGINKNKIIIIAGIAIIVIMLIIFLVIGLTKRDAVPEVVHTGASVMLVPLNAKAEINGSEYTNGTYYFEPGKYSAHISAEGFAGRDVEFEIKKAKLTTVAVYLTPTSGSYSDEDIDLLRFLSNDDDTNALIEERLLGKSDSFKFASYENGLLKAENVPLGDEYVGNSKKLVAETVSAYFYYAHPEITAFKSIEPPTDGKTFTIIIDDDQKYSVYFIAHKDETVTTSDVYNISYASLQKWGSDDEVFWYDGSFSYGGVRSPTYYTEDPSFD